MIALAASGRPHPGEQLSGDAHEVNWTGSSCRISLVDGLGHGPEAAAAAAFARSNLAAQPHLDPIEAIKACHQALRDTRGAAISVVKVDPITRRLVGAGVGNVVVHVKSSGASHTLLTDRGIVGYKLPVVHPFELTLGNDWLLIVHTDGMSARFGMEATLPRLAGGPQAFADEILRRWARDDDDATIVVAAQQTAT
jgi:serine phosphatase RsbU (regulator of sigma subunit)